MHTDYVHPFGEHSFWSESFHFSFCDRAKDLYGMMSIGLRPNLRLKEVLCYFMMPDGSTVGLKDSVAYDSPVLEAKGLRLDIIEPEKRWRMSFSGGMERETERKARKSHVEFDLRFEALNGIFDHRACVPDPGGRLSSDPVLERTEQAGRVEGRLSTGLDDFDISALGDRDHAWGVQDGMAPDGWARLTCQFSESQALSLTRFHSDHGPVDAGYLFSDGRNVPVVRADLNLNADFSRNIKSFDMTLHDSEGGAHKVFGSIIRKIDVHHRSPDGKSMTTMNEALARYTFAGKNGYGIAEFLQKTE